MQPTGPAGQFPPGLAGPSPWPDDSIAANRRKEIIKTAVLFMAGDFVNH